MVRLRTPEFRGKVTPRFTELAGRSNGSPVPTRRFLDLGGPMWSSRFTTAKKSVRACLPV